MSSLESAKTMIFPPCSLHSTRVLPKSSIIAFLGSVVRFTSLRYSLCCVYTVVSPVALSHGKYADTILKVWLDGPFIASEVHLPSPVGSAQDVGR